MSAKLVAQRPEEKIFTLSYSKAKTYEGCPAKFKFGYIEKLPKKDWEFTKFGKFLHEVLEEAHKMLQLDTRPFNQIMTQVFKSSLKNWDLTPEQKKEAYTICVNYLKDWSSRPIPQILGIEKEFNIIFDDQFLLGGFIDRVDFLPEEDLLEIVDYKTSKDAKYLKKDYLQLQTYAFALWLENPEIKRFKCSYIMLRLNSERVSQEFSLEEILKVEHKYLEYFENIMTETVYAPKPSPLCRFCDWVETPGCSTGKEFIKVQEQRRGSWGGVSNIGHLSIGETSWN